MIPLFRDESFPATLFQPRRRCPARLLQQYIDRNQVLPRTKARVLIWGLKLRRFSALAVKELRHEEGELNDKSPELDVGDLLLGVISILEPSRPGPTNQDKRGLQCDQWGRTAGLGRQRRGNF